MSTWKVSISELVKIFKGALVALIPWLGRARIPFAREDAYDDFDEISGTLFKRIVCATVDDALEGFGGLASYGMHRKNYESFSFIQIKNPNSHNDMTGFVAFEFDQESKIYIKVAVLNDDLSVKEFQSWLWQDLRFSLMRNCNGELSEIVEAEIDI